MRIRSKRRVESPPMTEERFADLLTCRLLLEPEAAVLAMPHIGPAHLRRLGEIDTAIDKAMEHGDVLAYMENNFAFHFSIYRANGRPTLNRLIETLWLQFGPWMRVVYGRYGTASLVDQHQAALTAIQLGDADALRAAISSDISDGMGLIGAPAAGARGLSAPLFPSQGGSVPKGRRGVGHAGGWLLRASASRSDPPSPGWLLRALLLQQPPQYSPSAEGERSAGASAMSDVDSSPGGSGSSAAAAGAILMRRRCILCAAKALRVIDNHGRAYLDMYNNVPCVGHAHPRIVEAMARQQATLNAHSRYLHEGVVAFAERLAALHHGAGDRERGVQLQRHRKQRGGAAHGPLRHRRARAASCSPTPPITATATWSAS